VTATPFNQRTIDEFHAKQGRGVGVWGDNLLLLTAKGARSGHQITTPLVYRRLGDDYVVVASKGGAPDNPHWFGNLRADPIVDLEVANSGRTERFQARATVLTNGPEHDRHFQYMTEVWPAFAAYQAKTGRTIPVVILKRLV
jgi:deazaflavin-dependent oxidoreductase (nitroreductase family)